ncbi:MAG: bifunctional nuclease family protein [bacterium]|nr:bifunctional nuclease family protein [bacterium]
MTGSPAPPEGTVIVEIKGLVLDPSSNLPIVVLRDIDGDRLLPIWIGLFEAQAIALGLEGVDTPRPMTHDLLLSLVEGVHAKISHVVVSDLIDNTFFAEIHVRRGSARETIDSRPSDAIALALRAEAPLFVHQQVFDKAQLTGLTDKLGDDERLKKWLEDAGPDELGKYEM